MITWTKRLLLTASFLALITTNILTLTSTAFNTRACNISARKFRGDSLKASPPEPSE
jgi:hypothetical protein